MSDRPSRERALGYLRAEVAADGRTPGVTTRAAWLAYTRFGRQRFGEGTVPGADGLLFQYGTYAFSGRPMFTVDLTRQFDVMDEDGDHDHYVQVHCELRYEPGPALDALDALGSFNAWFFHDIDTDLDQWFAAMEERLGPLLDTRPDEIDLHEERV